MGNHLKPVSVKLSKPPQSSFKFKKINLACLEFNWHCHPEYEIMYMSGSKGKRFIGDSIGYYQEGDLFFMGPNLPHTWYSPAGVLGQDRFHQAILVQFNEHMGGIDVQKIPECISIQHLFSISSRGLQFYGDTRNLVAKKLSEIQNSEGLNQLLILLSILDLLGKADHSEVEVLSSIEFTRCLQPRERSRIDRVCTFINLNYQEKLTLKDAADIANMSTTAFSRFFRKSTGKTFIRYVNELRIGWACKLLIESEKNIAEICYEVGFNNLSNFNRRFFERHNMSPRIYRQEFTANL